MAVSIKNVLIGVFVLVAIGIIVFMLLFLHPSVGDNAKTLRVRFTDLDKVNVGTRVTFAGRPVGEVIRISEIPEARFSRPDQNGDVYIYEVELKVDSGVDVFDSDEIMVRTSGLLGERNIEINPQPIKQNQQLRNIETEIIYAKQTGSVEDTLKSFDALSKKFEIVLDDLHGVLDNVKKEEIVENLSRSLQNVAEITDALNEPDKLKEVIDNVVNLSRRANDSWATVDNSLKNVHDLTARAHESWTTIDRALQQFYGAGRSANEMLAYARQGKGTLGEIVMGNSLYLRLKSVLHKGETVMDDMKTYGILFQTDKRWQRLQARRLQLMDRLHQPDQFSDYFNQEVDQISSSLSRVSMVLNESENYPDIHSDPQVRQSFSDLLKKVEGMQETLKLYNESVIAND